MTSHDVVARVRRLAGTRKVGHAGTLDPMATGVLVLGVGRATRILGHLALTTKAYDATIRLGSATTTDDAEGEVLETHPVDGLDDDTVRAALQAMVGEIDQVPSTVSAVKVAGRRAYDLARAGERVELKARPVRIDEISVRRMDLPEVDVAVRCSSGTYVRAIARDLGA
ncbi:MAG TPA: tRNA pseudouridine(55) synthase TruB, partial [Marmoricola sp.]|nr:tRNA pseudouridine(55) synthase TruB [Marmoricola sp.]